METYDDDLSRFAAEGPALLPATNEQGYVEQTAHESGTLLTDPARP